jgi:hypothetical protein
MLSLFVILIRLVLSQSVDISGSAWRSSYSPVIFVVQEARCIERVSLMHHHTRSKTEDISSFLLRYYYQLRSKM